MEPLYSHRQRASEPRSVETIDEPTWISIRELVSLSLRQGMFAEEFPIVCTRCRRKYRFNESAFNSSLKIEIPTLNPQVLASTTGVVATENVFDLVEFSYRNISFAEPYRLVSRCSGHWTGFRFDRERGRHQFRDSVNRIFDRQRIGFELTDDGEIMRFGAPILSDAIQNTWFQTGDADLNSLLATASQKFISRDPSVRREGLEKLWDAWERLKTLEFAGHKRASTSALLDRVADGPMRERLETEARELTDIGNEFMIRHSETDRYPLDDDRHVDYLFHRLFSMVYLLLDGTGRVGNGE